MLCLTSDGRARHVAVRSLPHGWALPTVRYRPSSSRAVRAP